MSEYSISRRRFLRASGNLTIGVSLIGSFSTLVADPKSITKLPGSLRRFPRIDAWVEILSNGQVRIFSGKVELGQGIRIAIKQVAAEELYQDLSNIEVVLAETGRTPNEGYTAGSGSIQNSAMAVRHAAAAAREKLLTLAAEKFSVAKEELSVVNGGIKHTTKEKILSFWELLEGKQIVEEVELPLEIVPTENRKYVGKPIAREDIPSIVTGKGIFIQDMSFPDMVYGKVLRPKNYQSELISFDEAGFESACPEAIQVIQKGRFLAVLARTDYQAEQGLKQLDTYSKWTEPAIFPEQDRLEQHLMDIADAPTLAKEKGNLDQVKPIASRKAQYFKPYTMHASLGPACAIAQYDKEVLHVWTHSQGIYPLREALAKMLGMPPSQLHLISVPGAGCFGHTVADDAAADAALLAMQQPGIPIKVQWNRQDEHRWEPYGSAMRMELEAGLDSQGKIISWQSHVWSDSHSTRPNSDAGTVLPARHLDPPISMKSRGYLGGGHRNADPYYDLPNFQVKAHFFEGPLRVSSLRSLGAYANIFAIESFMEELAEEAGQDPFAFRLNHLSDPRAIAVIQRLREQVKDPSTGEGEGIGIAFCRYKNNTSYCAIAAKVQVNLESKKLDLLHMWATIDVGEIINPDGLKNQVEGGIIQAASWTLMEEVRFSQTAILSRDWASYPIMGIAEAPEIEVILMDRPDQPAMGGGEVSVPPVGAAIANAIFHACGKRIYKLPLSKSL